MCRPNSSPRRFLMPRLKQCTGKTKAGKRCRNKAKPATPYCSIHSATDVPASVPKSRFEQVERGVKLFGSVSAGIGTLIKVVEFVSNHWPQIEHYFRVFTSNGLVFTIEEFRLRETRFIDKARTVRMFEIWYRSLPSDVQKEIVKQFGSVRAITNSVWRD
jgi:hypothetical protein